MSLWIPRRDKNGRLYFFVVELPITVIFAVVIIGVSLLVSCVATAPMSPQMRTAYRTGWVLMLIGATLALFAVWFASRIQSAI